VVAPGRSRAPIARDRARPWTTTTIEPGTAASQAAADAVFRSWRTARLHAGLSVHFRGRRGDSAGGRGPRKTRDSCRSSCRAAIPRLAGPPTLCELRRGLASGTCRDEALAKSGRLALHLWLRRQPRHDICGPATGFPSPPHAPGSSGPSTSSGSAKAVRASAARSG
jgi:hypothetical protein